MIRIIICDDEQIFLNNIENYLLNVIDEQAIAAKVHTFNDLKQISEPILSSCDIAFLDIDFGQVAYNGLDVARKLRKVRKDAIIIFVTNYIEYAPEGYEVQAFRYMMKKDIKYKLPEYIQLAINQLKTSRATLKIKISGEIIDIPIQDILYIESQLRMVIFHVQKAKTLKQYSCYGAISDYEEQLEQQGFLRIHKSFLVNMKHIKRLRHDEAMLSNGSFLRVSQKNYSTLKKKYLLWRGVS